MKAQLGKQLDDWFKWFAKECDKRIEDCGNRNSPKKST